MPSLGRELWEAMVAAGTEEAHRRATAADLVADAVHEREVDAQSAAFLSTAFRQLGVFQYAHDARTVAGVIADCGVLPKYDKVLRRWMEALVEEGLLERREDDAYVALEPVPTPALDALMTAEQREYYSKNLAAVLTGEIHPLEFYLPGGSSASVESSYRETPSSATATASPPRCWRRRRKACRPGRGCACSRVGAGTGGTTASLLPLLPPEQSVFLFTDVSKFFTDLGRKKFQELSFVHYKELDIEADPVPQGYPAESCDWIVAAHVLHATRNVGETLRHILRLLAPAGVLLLLEETRFQRKYNFSMGFLPGFDHFEDYDRRPLHPLLSSAKWREALLTAGFVDFATFTEPGSAADVLGVDVMLARAAGRFLKAMPTVEDRRSRLTPAQRALLAKRLRGGLEDSPAAAPAADPWTMTPRPDPDNPAPLSYVQTRLWHAAAAEPESPASNVYYAVGLRGPLHVAALARGMRAVVERHQALWSRFPRREGAPVAETAADLLPAALPAIDLSALPEAAREAEAFSLALALAAPPFDLTRGPLLRTALIRTGPEAHALLLAVHHIVIDGWTLGLLTPRDRGLLRGLRRRRAIAAAGAAAAGHRLRRLAAAAGGGGGARRRSRLVARSSRRRSGRRSGPSRPARGASGALHGERRAARGRGAQGARPAPAGDPLRHPSRRPQGTAARPHGRHRHHRRPRRSSCAAGRRRRASSATCSTCWRCAPTPVAIPPSPSCCAASATPSSAPSPIARRRSNGWRRSCCPGAIRARRPGSG